MGPHILVISYKSTPISDHVAKFHHYWQTNLGDSHWKKCILAAKQKALKN